MNLISFSKSRPKPCSSLDIWRVLKKVNNIWSVILRLAIILKGLVQNENVGPWAGPTSVLSQADDGSHVISASEARMLLVPVQSGPWAPSYLPDGVVLPAQGEAGNHLASSPQVWTWPSAGRLQNVDLLTLSWRPGGGREPQSGCGGGGVWGLRAGTGSVQKQRRWGRVWAEASSPWHVLHRPVRLHVIKQIQD